VIVRDFALKFYGMKMGSFFFKKKVTSYFESWRDTIKTCSTTHLPLHTCPLIDLAAQVIYNKFLSCGHHFWVPNQDQAHCNSLMPFGPGLICRSNFHPSCGEETYFRTFRIIEVV
jgi:hypothetical protein